MSDSKPIICKPTNWFYFRVLAMFVMFTAFALYFCYDWKYGYRKKNLQYYTHQTFKEAGDTRKNVETQEQWEADSVGKNLNLGEDFKGELPIGLETPIAWPDVLKKIGKENSKKNWNTAWNEYSDEQGWASDAPDKSHDAQSVQEQLYWGMGSGVFGLVALFFFMRTTQRHLKVDDEAFYGPNGKKILFSKITKIDKRKWDTKGLAHLYYDENGSEQKCKIDGLVYGQFKEEDGAPAEALFQRVLENFSGELIDLAPEEDEDDEESHDGNPSPSEASPAQEKLEKSQD